MMKNIKAPVLVQTDSFARWWIVACCIVVFALSAAWTGRAQAPTTNISIIQFSDTAYQVDEILGTVNISVTRTGDLSGLTFGYVSTLDGTARAGVDYLGIRPPTGLGGFVNPNVVFFPGDSIVSVPITIIDNFIQDGNRTFNVLLSDLSFFVGTSTTVLGAPTNAVVTIIDDEGIPQGNVAGQVQWSTTAYSITPEEWVTSTAWDDEPEGARLTIVRRGGSRGRILVDWRLFPGTALPGFDYNTDAANTNGTVALQDFQMSTNILIRIPIYDPVVSAPTKSLTNFPGPPKTFFVRLSNVRADPQEDPAQIQPTLGAATNALVNIVDYYNGHAFNRLHYTVRETRGKKFGDTNAAGVISIPVRPGAPTQPGGEVFVHYVINPLRVIVIGTGGDHLNNQFPLKPGSDYASPFVDFEPVDSDEWRATLVPITNPDVTEAILRWAPPEYDMKNILVPIINDDTCEFNEDFQIRLFKLGGETDSFVNFNASLCTVTILFDDQPAGAVDRTYNPDFDFSTQPPYNSIPGANNTVNAVAVQPDGKLVLGGDFGSVNTTLRNRIARMTPAGQLDERFNPGLGANDSVSSVALQDDGGIVIGGAFTSINGILRRRIARLDTNGVLDATFNPGLGANDFVRAIAVQSDGKILVGGEFTSINGTNRNYLARLNSNGSLDTTFNPPAGPNGPVHSIALTAPALEVDHDAAGGPAEDRFPVETGSNSGTITVDYDFLQVPDSLRIYYEGNIIFDSGLISGAAQINIQYAGNSSLLEFVMNEGSGLSGTLWFYRLTIAPNVDPRPVIGGNFTSYDGVPRNYVARINLDGTLDTGFNPGTGADDVVYAVAKQGNKVIMGGSFHSVDLRSRNSIARLNENGSLDNTYFPGTGANDSVYAVAIQPNGKAVIGGIFTSINSTRRLGLARLNSNGTVDTTFMDTAYNQLAGLINPLSPENILSQENFIRSLATYRLTNITYLTNIVVTNNITNEIISTNIALIDQVFGGGRFSRVGGGFRRDDIRNRNNFARFIGGATAGPGNLEFLSPDYRIDENGGRSFISMVRTNGSLGPASVQFGTVDPPAGPGVAQAGADYGVTTAFPIWISSWNVDRNDRMFSAARMGPNFNTYTTNRARNDFNIYNFPDAPPLGFSNPAADDVFVSIFEDPLIEGDEVLDLKLSNPDGTRLVLGGEPIPLGLALGRAEATLTIADNDFSFGTLGFGSPTYTVSEDDGQRSATINVTRVGGVTGAISIDYETRDGTAKVPLDYKTVRGTLRFAEGQTNATFTIPIVDDTIAEFEESVQLVLSNPAGFPDNVPYGSRLDTNRTTAVLTIIDNDFAFGRLSFEKAVFAVSESEPSVTVTVKRTGGNLGDVVVDYATSNGTAVAGTNYLARSGKLQWVDGDISSKSFTVPLIDNAAVENDKLFTVTLSSPIVLGVLNTNALGIQPVATVRIINDDAYGAMAFSQPVYNIDENGPVANITVLRSGGIAGTISVNFAATNLDAVAGVDFVATNGTLTFGPGEVSKSFRVAILDDSVVEGDKQILLTLSGVVQGSITNPSVSSLVIIDNELQRVPAGTLDSTFADATGTDGFIYGLAEQSDGGLIIGGDFRFINDITRNKLARLNQDGSVDRRFDPFLGPNGSVRAVTLEANGRILLGGLFTSVNNTNRNYIARLNFDGSIDPTFDPGAAADNPIYAITLQPDGKAIIGGDFASYNGVSRNYIARLNTNGVLDASFDVGTGANKAVFAVALQSDGKILVGGDFDVINGAPRVRIARLLRDGRVDPTFNAGLGPNNSVRAIALQTDGKIVIGGLFTSLNGNAAGRIARLNPDGTVDASFATGVGANDPVNALAIQIDGKIVLGGDFTRFADVTANRIARINSDGSTDPTINFGSGANSTVSAILIESDRKIVISGGFTEFNGVPRKRIARVHGGSIAGPGAIEFTRANYTVAENSTNAVIAVRRVGGLTGSVAVDLRVVGGSAIPGVDYTFDAATAVFPTGESFKEFKVPIIDDALPDADVTVVFGVSNVTGGAILGPQPTATLTIENDDSAIGFSQDTYSVAENSNSQTASITVLRSGSKSGIVTLEFLTQDGTATAGLDYTAVRQTLQFVAGEASRTFSIPILDDTIVEGGESIRLILTNLTGQASLSRPEATLTINDNDTAPGDVGFSDGIYNVIESQGPAVIRVRRVGGSTGAIQVEYATRGVTANPGSDYTEVSGILTFGEGITEQFFNVPITSDLFVEGNESVEITLSNPTGGAKIFGSPKAILNIVDDDLGAGSVDQSFNPGAGANDAVRAVKVDNVGQIVIGGDFTNFAGIARSRVARLNSNGTIDTTLNPGKGADNFISSLALQDDGKLLISGLFARVNDTIQNHVARLNSNGQLDSGFNLPLGLNAEVTSVLQQPDGKVIIGGVFDIASAAGRNRIARLNSNGTLDTGFDPGTGADAPVYAVALQDSKIIVGGAFNSINGIARKGVVRLNVNGTVDATFQLGAGANGEVRAVFVLPDGKILLGGSFTSVNGITRNRVARLNADGSLDTSFDPGAGPNNTVLAILAQADGTVLIGGDFSQIGLTARSRIARLTTTGVLDGTFDPGAGADASVLGLAQQWYDGKIVVVGRFKTFDRLSRSGIVRLNGDKALVPEDLKVGKIAVLSTGEVRFQFNTQISRSYLVELSVDLKTWTSVETIKATSTTTEFTDRTQGRPNPRYYRVRRVAP